MKKNLKGFLRATALVTMSGSGIAATLAVSSAQAATECGAKPAVPAHHVIPANNETVHWGYFSKVRKPQAVVHSGDFVTLETLTHHANDDADRMVTGDPGAESVFNPDFS